jgi:hypothetical protein
MNAVDPGDAARFCWWDFGTARGDPSVNVEIPGSME